MHIQTLKQGYFYMLYVCVCVCVCSVASVLSDS